VTWKTGQQVANLASRLKRLELAIPAEPQPAADRGPSLTEQVRAELRELLADIEARKARGEPPPPSTPESEALTAEIRQLLAEALNQREEPATSEWTSIRESTEGSAAAGLEKV
jgi:hypothetical protein